MISVRDNEGHVYIASHAVLTIDSHFLVLINRDFYTYLSLQATHHSFIPIILKLMPQFGQNNLKLHTLHIYTMKWVVVITS